MPWSRDPHDVPAAHAGERFVDHLKAHLIVVPVTEIGAAITSGEIRLAGRHGRTDTRLAAGDRVEITPTLETRLAAAGRLTPPADLPVEVVWEDAHLLVANKPAGMHVHPLGAFRDATLLNALVHRAGARPESPWGAWRPHPAHRLDRPVSGLVLVAKSAGVRDALGALFGERSEAAIPGAGLTRRYLAWVDGEMTAVRGTVDAPVGRDPSFDYRRAIVSEESGGQSAVTHWEVRDRRGGRTLLALTLETGRTHQIRVHLASLGHPVSGDRLYALPPARVASDPGRGAATRIALHAEALSFVHPVTGAVLEVRTEPPAGFDEIG